MKNIILDRFLSYVAIDTQSDDASDTCPSTPKQFDLLNLLKEEMQQMGLQGISLDQKGYLMGYLPSNCNHEIPAIGFISHVDTSPDMSGAQVKPKVIEHYDGRNIMLNQEAQIMLTPDDFPELLDYTGKTLITTDGTTLLGADDKAGIAEIMTAIEYLCQHPEIPHGKICIGFTPDEEIGRGVDYFDVAAFGADFAYTMDGGSLGELEYENFNAAGAKINIQGRNIHPGYAKSKMLNSLLLAMEFNSLLAVNERPEYTAAYEGFFHLVKVEGNVEHCVIQYIIRDHDRGKFEQKKVFIQQALQFMNQKYPGNPFSMELKDQYYNMKEKVEPVIHIVESAAKAMEAVGVEPRIMPIRGGTDGARLSFMGLPCPNIFAGGVNFHGKFEFVALETMEKAAQVILKIIEMYAKES